MITNERLGELPEDTKLYRVAELWDGVVDLVEKTVGEVASYDSSFIGWRLTEKEAILVFLAEQNGYIEDLKSSIEDLETEIDRVEKHFDAAKCLLANLK